MSIFSFKRTLRNVNLTVSAATFDELAGMIEASDGGALNMEGISLVRGQDALPAEDDPIARHRARVLAPKTAGHHCG